MGNLTLRERNCGKLASSFTSLIRKQKICLDIDKIRQSVPDLESADFWFCGPTGFGESLKAEAVINGLSAADFHQKLFEMR
jgi:ferredoxin-NADP reductase